MGIGRGEVEVEEDGEVKDWGNRVEQVLVNVGKQ